MRFHLQSSREREKGIDPSIHEEYNAGYERERTEWGRVERWHSPRVLQSLLSKLRPGQEWSSRLWTGHVHLESPGNESKSAALQVKGCINVSEAGEEARTRSHGLGRSRLRGEARKEERD